MRTRLAAIALISLTLAACKPSAPPAKGVLAPGFGLSTVLSDLQSPEGLAVAPDGLYLSTKSGLVLMGPEGAIRSLAPSGKTLKAPAGLALATGSLFIADAGANRVWRMVEDAPPEAFAGTGTTLFPIGDGGLAVSAQLDAPRDVGLDGQGDLFIADTGHHRIRQVDRDGRIVTLAGDGTPRFAETSLNRPTALAVAPDGTVYVADTGNHAVRRIAPGGQLTTVAGNGQEGFSGDGGPATESQLASPSGIVLLPGGDLLVSDTGNRRIRWIRPGGAIQTVAGTGASGRTDEAPDATKAALEAPGPIALAPDETPFVVDVAAGRVYQLRPRSATQSALPERVSGEQKQGG